MMSLKRQTACLFNLRELASSGDLYLWTFTFRQFSRPENVRCMVNSLVKLLGALGASGVRVYENHKRGSLHVHLVINRRLCVVRVRKLWEKWGGGRLHVLPITDGSKGEYIAKELSKNKQQAGMEKGVRIYACFGPLWKSLDKTLVKDVQRTSNDFASYFYRRYPSHRDAVMFNFYQEFAAVGYANASELSQAEKWKVGDL